jgi:hypothetical protein
VSREVTSRRIGWTGTRSKSAACGLTLLCFALLAGCGGDDNTASGDSLPVGDAGTALTTNDAAPALTGAKFSEIYALIFPSISNPRCDSCHAMPASEISNGKLHMGMDRATAYNALVGKMSSGRKCVGKMLVVPGQPDMSLLLQKLGPTPPCGSRMPIGGAPLTDAQMEMIRSWIAAGAQND